MRHVADRMRSIGAIAQCLARLGPLRDAAHFDLELPFDHRQAFHGAALMRLGFQHAAGIGRNHTIEPFDRLDPADDGEPALAIVGNQDRRVAARGFFQKGLVVGRRQHPLDRDIERLREAPDRGECRIGLVALDLADDRFRDARLSGQFRQRKIISLAQPLHRLAKLARQGSRAGVQRLDLVTPFDTHGSGSPI